MRILIFLVVGCCLMIQIWAAPTDHNKDNGPSVDEKPRAAAILSDIELAELKLKIVSIMRQDELDTKQVEVILEGLKSVGITPTQLEYLQNFMKKIDSSKNKFETFLAPREPLVKLGGFLQQMSMPTAVENQVIQELMQLQEDLQAIRMEIEEHIILALIRARHNNDTLLNTLLKLKIRSWPHNSLQKLFEKELISLKTNMTVLEQEELAVMCKMVNFVRELLHMKVEMLLSEMSHILKLEQKMVDGNALTAEEQIILQRFRSNEHNANGTMIRMKLVSDLLLDKKHKSCEKLLILNYLHNEVDKGNQMPNIAGNLEHSLPEALKKFMNHVADVRQESAPFGVVPWNVGFGNSEPQNNFDGQFEFPSNFLVSSGLSSLNDNLINKLKSGSYLRRKEIVAVLMNIEQAIRKTKLILFLNMKAENTTYLNDVINGALDKQHDQKTTSDEGESTLVYNPAIEKIQEALKRLGDKGVAIIVHYLRGKANLKETLSAIENLDVNTNQADRGETAKRDATTITNNASSGKENTRQGHERVLIRSEMDKKLLKKIEGSVIEDLWILYKLKFNRLYSKPDNDFRRGIFVKMVHMIAEHNSNGKNKFKLGLNDLTDKTPAEVKVLRGARHPTTTGSSEAYPYFIGTYYNTIPADELPVTVDWTSTGFVGPVQNQGQCGSCWAFSATGSLQAQYYNKTGTYIEMSKQNLVDCSTGIGSNDGCNGGWYTNAFDYVLNIGMESANNYPYTAMDGECKYSSSLSVTSDNGWWNIESYDEVALQQAVVMIGPVSVGIDASQESFQAYSSGVYASSNCSQSNSDLDHCVLVVGYGTTTITTSSGQVDQDYWLIQNSWGTDWGMNGYMMMARNDNNMCGIATAAAVPIIN